MTTPPLPHGPATAPPGPARNLLVVLGVAGLVYFAWSWANFSGPFRLFVDVQLGLLGSYSEVAAAVASAVVIAAVATLLAIAFVRAFPHLTARAADAAVAALFVAASAGALWQAGHLWRDATHLPRLSDPVQIVDLGSAGRAAWPIAHVRVIGTPDRTRQAVGYSTGRYGFNSYWQSWTALIAHAPHDPNAPVGIVATGRGTDRAAAAAAIAEDPEGLLLFDSVDTRTV